MLFDIGLDSGLADADNCRGTHSRYVRDLRRIAIDHDRSRHYGDILSRNITGTLAAIGTRATETGRPARL
jgi:hypothetical protein